MEYSVMCAGRSVPLTYERLTEGWLDAAADLCDRCVGKNLYPRDALASVLDDPAHFFYLLTTPEREVAGYIYFSLTDLDTMAALCKLPVERMAEISPKASPVVGNLRSIGVAERFRDCHLSTELLRFALDYLRTKTAADVGVGICWKAGGVVPVEKTVKRLGFRFLSDAHRVWYDNDALVCPYCVGRCRCDAAIYYIPLKETGT